MCAEQLNYDTLAYIITSALEALVLRPAPLCLSASAKSTCQKGGKQRSLEQDPASSTISSSTSSTSSTSSAISSSTSSTAAPARTVGSVLVQHQQQQWQQQQRQQQQHPRLAVQRIVTHNKTVQQLITLNYLKLNHDTTCLASHARPSTTERNCRSILPCLH